MSLDAKYKDICTELEVKPNSAIMKQLAEEDDSITVWDLSSNVVGTRGAKVVAKLVSDAMPHLETLNLSGNNLTSPICDELLKYLVAHPALKTLDLSNNDVRLGGPALVELVKKNKKIVDLNIHKTFLRPLFERLIKIHVTRNKTRADEAAAAQTKKKAKTARFTFGFAEEGANEEVAAADEDAFAKFADAVEAEPEDRANEHVSFQSGARGGKKVKRRPTVCSEAYKEDEIDNFVPTVIEKEEKQRTFLKQILERHDLFSHLEDFELFIAIDAMDEAQKFDGDTIFCEGDEEGDLFYVVGSGEVELRQNDEVVGTLKKGDTTQDVMLMYAGEYKETAVCIQDSTVFSLDRKTYRCVLSQASKKKRALYEGFLSSVSFLKCLTKPELLQLADALKPAPYEAGTKLIKYGEVGTNFFLIVEGTVEVFGRNDQGETVKVCEFTSGDCVGELEFINNHKCVADVVAKGDIRTAKMNRHHFEMVMGPVKDVLARNAEENQVYEYYRHKLEKMEDEKKAE